MTVEFALLTPTGIFPGFVSALKTGVGQTATAILENVTQDVTGAMARPTRTEKFV